MEHKTSMLAATVLSLALSLLSLKNDHPWLAYVLVAFGSLTMLSTVFRKLEFYARSLVYVAGMGVVAFTGVFTSIFMALIGQRASAPWLVARLFYKSVGPLGECEWMLYFCGACKKRKTYEAIPFVLGFDSWREVPDRGPRVS